MRPWAGIAGCLVAAAFMLLTGMSGAAGAHSAMNRFWGELPVDMFITGDVLVVRTLVVPADVTLTIDPGAVVRFAGSEDGGNRILVLGRLVAAGTEDAPIMFIPKDGHSGPWYGIEFGDGGRGRLEHCVIKGAEEGVRDPGGGAELLDVDTR